MTYKYIVKNTAARAGYVATFMPKPLFVDNGSGMHVHQSLFDGDTALFCAGVRTATMLGVYRRPIRGELKIKQQR